MAILFRCELCGNNFDRATEVALMANRQPIMVRHYCAGCLPKIQFAVECFVRRTSSLEAQVGESAIPAA